MMLMEDECVVWFVEFIDEEKEKLRVKVRVLLICSGVLVVLMGVMG